MGTEGAFIAACRYVVEKDMEEKTRLIEHILAHPELYPPLSGQDFFAILFGDYQKAVDKYGPAFDRANPGT